MGSVSALRASGTTIMQMRVWSKRVMAKPDFLWASFQNPYPNLDEEECKAMIMMRRRGWPRLRFGLLLDPLGKNDHVPIGIKNRKLAHAVKSLVQRYFNLDLVLLHALKKLIKTFQFYVQADTAGPRLPAGPFLFAPAFIAKDLYTPGDYVNTTQHLLL